MLDNNPIKIYIKSKYPRVFKVIKYPKEKLVILWHNIEYLLYRFYIVYRVPVILKKKKIRVLFVLAELASWKTELLYLKMLKHPKFEPVIGITTNTIEAPGSKPILEKYIMEKEYDYVDLDLSPKSIDKIHPDFILYYKPYDGSYPPEQVFWRHIRVIPLGIAYAFNITDLKQHFKQPLYYWPYIYFAENEFTKQSFKKAIGFKSYNIRVTGTPMEDELLLPKENFEDQWKDRTGRKRIIYAPHHSFDGTNGKGLELATFLVNGEFMLEMAKKYSDKVTFAFKPHPNLRKKLNNIWGKERTDAYYHEWESLEYAQVDYGDYMGLFKYSDAIIHDCGSFTIEYLFMQKPSMYMVNSSENRVKAELNNFGKKAFDCYEHGLTHEQIEVFINGVVKGKDKLRNERQEFFNKYLKPPYGRTACENIIRSILGEKL